MIKDFTNILGRNLVSINVAGSHRSVECLYTINVDIVVSKIVSHINPSPSIVSYSVR